MQNLSRLFYAYCHVFLNTGAKRRRWGRRSAPVSRTGTSWTKQQQCACSPIILIHRPDAHTWSPMLSRKGSGCPHSSGRRFPGPRLNCVLMARDNTYYAVAMAGLAKGGPARPPNQLWSVRAGFAQQRGAHTCPRKGHTGALQQMRVHGEKAATMTKQTR